MAGQMFGWGTISDLLYKELLCHICADCRMAEEQEANAGIAGNKVPKEGAGGLSIKQTNRQRNEDCVRVRA